MLFRLSAPTAHHLPQNLLPEIALIGRSNVGKSSLLNHLCQSRIAKTSSIPGKTQHLNLYTIDDKLNVVDLPGFGYAKRPHVERARWGERIQEYLLGREQLKASLVLIDSRLGPTPLDQSCFDWLISAHLPFLVILTKTDKLKKSCKTHILRTIEEKLGVPTLPFSTQEARCRLALSHALQGILGAHP